MSKVSKARFAPVDRDSFCWISSLHNPLQHCFVCLVCAHVSKSTEFMHPQTFRQYKQYPSAQRVKTHNKCCFLFVFLHSRTFAFFCEILKGPFISPCPLFLFTTGLGRRITTSLNIISHPKPHFHSLAVLVSIPAPPVVVRAESAVRNLGWIFDER